MKKLPIFTAVLCLMALGSSVFAAIVTSDAGTSGNTINEAYKPNTTPQTLTLSGDVTETAVTSLNQTSTITLKSSDSTKVRTISTNGTDDYGPLPVFGNAKEGATINLSLNNVAVTGRLVKAGSNINSYPKGTVNVSGSGDLTLTGTGTALNDWGGTIYGENGVTLKGFENVTVTGYKAFNDGGAIGSDGDIEISNIKKLSFQNNEVTGDDEATGNGGAIYSQDTVSIHNITEVCFKGNKAIDKQSGAIGGAICGIVGITLSNLDSVTFEENEAATYGGAIFSWGSFAFSGDNSTFTFSGNTANGKSNDIVVGADGSTISGKSKYSFGGGITGLGFDDEWNLIPAQYTLGISNGADVTFESGSITDLGVLTVDASTMTVKAGATSTYTGLTLKNNPTVSFGTYPTSVGKLTLDNTNNVSVSQMTDLLGVATDLTAQNSSVVNLQNGSVDTVKLDGTITISGSTVDFDILSSTDYDSLNATGTIAFTDTTFNIDDTGLAANQEYDLAKGSSVTENGTNVTFKNSTVDYTLSVKDGNTLHMKINSVTPVPEPATWGLLILGSFGLLWLKKRK